MSDEALLAKSTVKDSICLSPKMSLANFAIVALSIPPLNNMPTGTSDLNCILTDSFINSFVFLIAVSRFP